MKYSVPFLLAVLSAMLIAGCDPLQSQKRASPGAPKSWIDAPLDGSRVPLAPLQVVSHSSDPLRIVQVELSVNGAAVHTAPNPDTMETLVTTKQSWSPPAPGNYTLMVRAQNSAGAWGPYAEAVVTIGASAITPPAQPTSPRTEPTATRPGGATSTSTRVVTATRTPIRPSTATATPTRTRTVPPTATFTQPPPTATFTRSPTPGDTQGPAAPTQISPIGGVLVQCVQTSLIWRAPSDPSGIRDYDVELQRLAGRSYVADKSWNDQSGSSVSFTPACSMDYRWRVRATDNAGNAGSWSGYQTFSVGAIPPPR